MPKSKWFRVATEGATTDGREITRTDIEQMAASYKPATYGARIWLEHYRGTVPGGPFDALGDVLAVEARDVDGGKKALFAQVEPLPALIEMNKRGQKLYTSVEIHPAFPVTGGAYLFGLAVTDSPASLGTEVLKFAAGAQHNPFAGRKTDTAVLFTEAQELGLELEAGQSTPTEPSVLAAAIAKFTGLMEKLQPTTEKSSTPPAVQQHSAMPAQVAEALAAIPDALKAFGTQQDATAQALAKLQQDHSALVQKLSSQQADPSHPPALGGDGRALADY